MTVTVVSTAIDAAPGGLVVGNGDLLVVQQTGVISYEALAVNATVKVGTGASVVVSGVVYGDYTALDCLGSDAITIQATGVVQGSVGVSLGGGSNLTNNGTILGNVDAIDMLGAGTVTNNGTIASDTDTGVQMAASDTIVINTGHISGQAKGVQLNGDVARAQVTNSGDISSDTGAGVRDLGVSSTVVNTGRITGETVGVLVTSVASGGSHALNNSGTITATGIGVTIDNALLMRTTVENSGTISGTVGLQIVSSLKTSGATVTVLNAQGGVILGTTGQAVLVTDTSNPLFLTNEGTITASGLNGGTVHSAAGLTLDNAGQITATDFAGTAILMDGAAQARITNTGTIQGLVTLGSGNDSVVNQGTINGNVTLGDGSDLFNGTGGHVTGVVSGGAGGDIYQIDDPTILISEAVGGGNDTLLTAVNFSLLASQEIETVSLIGAAQSVTGNDFVNTLNGNALANTLNGLGGNDTLSGNVGNDTLNGGAGNDSLIGGDDDDRLLGDAGADLLSGDNGDDVLLGQASNDTLNGVSGDDVLKGQAGTDSLAGGDGDDALTGGKGRDSLTGGLDEDTFIYTKTADTGTVALATNDIITDFTRGADRIDLSLIDANANTASNDAFSFIGTAAFTGVAGQLRFFLSGANVVVEGDVTGDGLADFQIQMNGLTAVGSGDFVL